MLDRNRFFVYTIQVYFVCKRFVRVDPNKLINEGFGMKKNMITRLMSLVLALTMVMAVTGCGSRDMSSTPTSSAPSSSAPVEESKPSEEVSESTAPSASSAPTESETRELVFLGDKLDAGIARNEDTVAWLMIPDTEINDAVLQSYDNNYYLRLTEDKTYSVFGCYYASYDCILDLGREELSRNTVIFGHSDYKDNPDGKKFSQLFKYTDLEFLKKNPYIYFSTPDDDMVWQVFSVFYTHVNFNYIQANPTAENFEKIIAEAKAKSEYIIDLDVGKNDKILTLSTCTKYYNEADYENYRFVVMAKLLDTNSVPTECPTSMTINPSPKKS